MYIAPNSTIKILKNVPLDLTYDHTIYFSPDSAGNTAQYNYFVAKTKYTLTEQSYQRVKRGWMRVNIVADNLYDCNYLMFQNTNFGTKWFYAFIKSVEYINNAVSEIEFEIDVMQTWNSEYTLDYCFVDREHSETDKFGENVVAENFDLGSSYISNTKAILDFTVHSIFVCWADSTRDGYKFPDTATYHNNYYSPLSYNYVTDTTEIESGIHTKLAPYMTSSLVSIFEYPRRLINIVYNPYYPDDITKAYIAAHDELITIDASAFFSRAFPVISDIPVKNRKLLTAPYMYIKVHNSSGQSKKYNPEDFLLTENSSTINFLVKGFPFPEPYICAYPVNYRGWQTNFDEGLPFSCLIVPHYVDSYRDWILNNKYQNESNIISGAVESIANGLITGGTKGGYVGAIAGMATGTISHITNVNQIVAKNNDMINAPDIGKPGSQGSFTEAMSQGLYGYLIEIISLKSEYVKIIDDYFTRYGYATHRTKIPNRNVRPHWTYTKTIGCTITGSVPCDDMKKICSIYDNGITFWKNGDEIGNYALENSAISME